VLGRNIAVPACSARRNGATSSWCSTLGHSKILLVNQLAMKRVGDLNSQLCAWPDRLRQLEAKTVSELEIREVSQQVSNYLAVRAPINFCLLSFRLTFNTYSFFMNSFTETAESMRLDVIAFGVEGAQSCHVRFQRRSRSKDGRFNGMLGVG